MSKIIYFSDHKRTVNHELCRQCPHDESCSDTCIAIEILVKLAKMKSPMEQIESINNIGIYLDLDNSF